MPATTATNNDYDDWRGDNMTDIAIANFPHVRGRWGKWRTFSSTAAWQWWLQQGRGDPTPPHGRVRRKMVAAKGDKTNDCVHQSKQKSTNNGGERMGRGWWWQWTSMADCKSRGKGQQRWPNDERRHHHCHMQTTINLKSGGNNGCKERGCRKGEDTTTMTILYNNWVEWKWCGRGDGD